MLATKTDSMALLFAVHASAGARCTCHRAGFCLACGSYRPAVEDPEVLDALSEDARRSPDRRVVRKRLDD